MVPDDVGTVGIPDAGDARLGGRITDTAARQVVPDRADRVLPVVRVVQDDLAPTREHATDGGHDRLGLAQQRLVLGHMNSLPIAAAALRPDPVRTTTTVSPGRIASLEAKASIAAAAEAEVGSA